MTTLNTTHDHGHDHGHDNGHVETADQAPSGAHTLAGFPPGNLAQAVTGDAPERLREDMGATAGDTTTEDTTGDDSALSAADARTHARATWRESGRSLSGADLGARYGRGDRWGRAQIAAARTEDAHTEHAAADQPAPPAHDPAPPAPATVPPDTRGRAGGTADHADGTVRRAAGTTTTERPMPTDAAPVPSDATAAATGVPPLPASLRRLTIGAVVIVAVVCAVTSYVHLAALVAAAGGGWLSWVLPLGMDGMAIAGTATLVAHHRYSAGTRRSRRLAWAAVALGLAASAAGNVAAVDPALVDLRHVRWALAAYPPAALALVSDLAFGMLRR